MNVCFVETSWDFPRVAALPPNSQVPRVGETVALKAPNAKHAQTYRVTAVYWWFEGGDDRDTLVTLPDETCTVTLERLPATFHVDFATATPEPDDAAEHALAHLMSAGQLRALRGDSPIVEAVAVELETAGLVTLSGKTDAGEDDWILTALGRRIIKRAIAQGR